MISRALVIWRVLVISLLNRLSILMQIRRSCDFRFRANDNKTGKLYRKPLTEFKSKQRSKACYLGCVLIEVMSAEHCKILQKSTHNYIFYTEKINSSPMNFEDYYVDVVFQSQFDYACSAFVSASNYLRCVVFLIGDFKI